MTAPHDQDHAVCVRCVMNTSDPGLDLDREGVCRYCRTAPALLGRVQPNERQSAERLARLSQTIRSAGIGREYDAVIGLSGGVDSSYAAHLAHDVGLRLLAVHFDNGWNSELAVANIHGIVGALALDLETYVINWQEFRDLQRAFLKASVIDIELITDHAIFAAMAELAHRHKIRYIVSGTNIATEHGLPTSWVWPKQDWRNIQAIHREFGTIPLATYPHLSAGGWLIARMRRRVKLAEPLNMIRFRRDEAAATLRAVYEWRDYGDKHHESLFTKFYQGFILPQKFGVDKRRAHLSDRIRNGELSRDEALAMLREPPYTPADLAREKEYVLKKLGFTEHEFASIMATPPRSHTDFASDRRTIGLIRTAYLAVRWYRARRQ